MALLLAGLSSLLYGVADFAGGFATRRERATAVVVWSQLIGVAALVAVVPLLADNGLTTRDSLLGGAAGVAGAAALVLFYQGLATGRVVVVAPVAALMSALVPIVGGLLLGERPTLLASLGVAAALPAIWLVSAGRRETHEGPTQAWMGLAAGIGFGLFFVLISQTTPGSGLWPLIPARAASIGLVAIFGAVGGTLRVSSSNLGIIAITGLLDMGANVAFLLASRSQLLVLVAVVTSLYPAATVVLARTVLHERLRGRQPAGLVLAVAAVVLIAAG